MFFEKRSRRNFFRLLSCGLIIGPQAYAQSARLSIGKTIEGVRVLATINPPDSKCKLLLSTDGGRTWSFVSEAPIVVGTGRLLWILKTTKSQAAIFRLLFATGAVIQLPGNLFFAVPDGQTLFVAMTSLRTSTPSFSFESEYKEKLKGQFVTHINRVGGEWVFEINGKPFLDAGSSGYALQKNDEIQWKLKLV